MKTFLKEVLLELKNSHESISDLIIIVPSKRTRLFIKLELQKLYPDQSFFAPTILSIEEFITQLSGLQQIDSTQTLFEFYESYINTHKDQEKESFDTFSNWGKTLINDFNEIDRYCIDHKSFFNYLSGIQDLNHWYLQKDKTDLIKNYIRFWENLDEYYDHFKTKLLNKKIGYQGLLYRKASEEIDNYINSENRKHILLGFNALNNAEQLIFQSLLEAGNTNIFWDADEFFVNNSYHEASLFIRNYKKKWRYYQKNELQWIHNNFSENKDISILGVPKNVGQAKLVGQILTKIPKAEQERTAVVLADETLLQPILNAIPDTVESLNITMGLPLKEAPISSFFELIFKLHKNHATDKLYYKSVLEILNSPAAQILLKNSASTITNSITKENIVYVAVDFLYKITHEDEKHIISLLFSSWLDVSDALEKSQKIIYALKEFYKNSRNDLALEHLYHFHKVFNTLISLHQTYDYLTSIDALHTLYKDILKTETLDFTGEPFRGLQLMGMLESRCLDFDTVILTSVNEGILPAGKSISSFIPYDLKLAYNLPTYKEKDAIYTYHFYRLIQRAKKVYVLYNAEDSGVGGGEKSRFLRQLEIDKRPKHNVSNYVVTSDVPKINTNLIEIKKNNSVIDQLKSLANYGFSPSALTSYIRNPIDFYYRYILGVKDTTEVEETIAANTLGTVIHNTLEEFYKPLEQKTLTVAAIEKMIATIDVELTNQFKKEYSKLNITQGKNLLIYEVAKRNIFTFLKSEEKIVQSGSEIKILEIETNLKAKIEIPELDFPVYIKGKVDRIDMLDGKIRIIDYKTGSVTKGDLILKDWSLLTQDYKYSKALQVLAYAYMYDKTNETNDSFNAGIISFKSLNSGYLKFGDKTQKSLDHDITSSIFDLYLIELKRLLLEIFAISSPFIEKEV